MSFDLSTHKVCLYHGRSSWFVIWLDGTHCRRALEVFFCPFPTCTFVMLYIDVIVWYSACVFSLNNMVILAGLSSVNQNLSLRRWNRWVHCKSRLRIRIVFIVKCPFAADNQLLHSSNHPKILYSDVGDARLSDFQLRPHWVSPLLRLVLVNKGQVFTFAKFALIKDSLPWWPQIPNMVYARWGELSLVRS